MRFTFGEGSELRSGRGHIFAGSTMGLAVACVVAASLASANPPSRGGTIRPGGTTFIPNGPVSSFGAVDVAGRGRSLCPGKSCVTPQQLQAAYDFPTG